MFACAFSLRSHCPLKSGAYPAGNLQELMLHETSVAWIRDGLAKSVPAKAWEESREQYEARLKRIVEEINGKNDVEGLCRSFLARIEKLVAGEGGRLRE